MSLEIIESASARKVLFMGEAITDEYRFVAHLSKPSKENILAVRQKFSESYMGGVDAAYEHASTFCMASLAAWRTGIRKIRYVEENYGRKLFEVQELKEAPPLEFSQIDFSAFDVVCVTDFGHGAFTAATIARLCEKARYLAVACQTNAANMGYNLITRWPAADYVVIDEPEARLAAQDRESPLDEVMRKLAAGRYGTMIVTHGKRGSYSLRNGEVLYSPAFTGTALDTMGAGDAFFAVTASMAPLANMPALLRIGNAAGALKCGILGHREAVTKSALLDYLKAHA